MAEMGKHVHEIEHDGRHTGDLSWDQSTCSHDVRCCNRGIHTGWNGNLVCESCMLGDVGSIDTRRPEGRKNLVYG